MLRRLVLFFALAFTAVGCSQFGSLNAIPKSTANVRSLTSPKDDGFKTIFEFHVSDGSDPVAALTAQQGVLYGTTYRGGAYGYGTLFSLTTSGKEKVLHSFSQDGVAPAARLLILNGIFYGTTSGGGRNRYGSVFAIKTSGKQLWSYAFKGGADGIDPQGGLMVQSGNLFGATWSGGNQHDGSVYKITPSHAEIQLHAFVGNHDGANPDGELLRVGHLFYGTTSAGGGVYPADYGTVFSVTPSGQEKILHAFADNYQDGIEPLAGLTAMNGALYGTTQWGGKYENGTVFSITTAGKERVVYSFGKNATDGTNPEAPVVAQNGNLFGTTAWGGANGKGTVFEVTVSGKERVLHSFDWYDGTSPVSGLIALNGLLYGTTDSGGTYSVGTIFALKP
ncbi:MAG: choice-of-anchor tandem repeat GloVer-containing protein [Candidatus Cybelea sp.]